MYQHYFAFKTGQLPLRGGHNLHPHATKPKLPTKAQAKAKRKAQRQARKAQRK